MQDLNEFWHDWAASSLNSPTIQRPNLLNGLGDLPRPYNSTSIGGVLASGEIDITARRLFVAFRANAIFTTHALGESGHFFDITWKSSRPLAEIRLPEF